AFGAAAAAPLSPPAEGPPAAMSAGMSREEVFRYIAEAVAASEARQRDAVARLVQAAAREADARRLSDRQELAESFRYFQAAQVNMWKQQVESQQIVSALAQRAGWNSAPQP
ncbi:MAG TPA: hypothetical protein VNN17_04080, partial [Terriglobia bacterium]|nr:hypothetical protein [Terriglobia bacterium]